MGNQNTKESASSLFSVDELKGLESTFRSLSGHSDKITHEKLLAAWQNIVDPQLADYLANYIYCCGQQRAAAVAFNRFTAPYYIVEHGTLDEKMQLLAGSIASVPSNQIVLKELENYITALLRSYISIHVSKCDGTLLSWQQHGYTFSERSTHTFSKAQVRSVSKDSTPKIDISELGRWLEANPTFLRIWTDVLAHLYGAHSGKTYKLSASPDMYIMPNCEGIPYGTNYTPILEIPHIIFINSNLPTEFRHKWRFLFSSKIHGESFSTMLGKITHKGPTFFAIEDEDYFVFGGYASDTWTLSPNFVGNNSSMLFTISPAMRCFNATGYNDHYQYLNLNQQTMPNGLGMGGQFNYWGLWIDCEYGLGQSNVSCTTYHDYVQLSKRKDFKIRNLEVWGIGDEPKAADDSDDESNKCSVLDKNLEDRVMLELAGKKVHSDGFRESDKDL